MAYRCTDGRWRPGGTPTEKIRFKLEEGRAISKPVGGRGGLTLVSTLERNARALPSEIAYRFLSDRGVATTWTWSQLYEAALRVSGGLHARVRPPFRAVLLEPPGLRYLAGFFGILHAGGAAVPLLPPRSARNRLRLSRAVAVAEPSVILAPPETRSRLAEGLETSASWTSVQALNDEDHSAGNDSKPTEDDIACLQFTSGSTGDPKGVVLRHRSLVHNLEQIRRAFGLDDAFAGVGWLPLQHDMGLIGNILTPLYAGKPCTLMAPETFLMRPVRWLEAVSKYSATVSGGPDFAYGLCADRIKEAELEGLDLSKWRVAFNGAEPVTTGHMERFARRFQAVGFRSEAFLPCYGLAEATLMVACGPVESPPEVVRFDGEALTAGRLVPAKDQASSKALLAHGGPHLEQRVEVVDGERRVAVEDGTIGELWVAGESVADGYYRNPEATKEAFGARLEGDVDHKWLRTGDLGGRVNGQLFITGRVKDLIIMGGRNLYPQDLERLAEEAAPALVPGGSIAFSVAEESGERLVLAAEVRRTEVRKVDPQNILQAIRSAMFKCEGVALSEVVLLRPGALPRTTSGKPRRSTCRNDYLAGDLISIAEF